MQHLQVQEKKTRRERKLRKSPHVPPPLPLYISIKIENTLTSTEKERWACRKARERDRASESERENNIILKAITMNSPQFRHESAPLSLTAGGKKRKKRKRREERNRALRRIPMSDRRLISAPGRILQTRLYLRGR